MWLGVTTQGNRVTGVFEHGPAHAAGISPGDELVAIDRFRATADGDLRTLLGARKIGERVTVTLFRRHKLVDAPVTLAAAMATCPSTTGTVSTVPSPGASTFVLES